MDTITPETKKPRRLTKKQRGFVKDYVETGNGTQAALKNYDIESPNKDMVAASIAHGNLRKPQVINEIMSIADGIPDDLVVRKHNKLFEQKQLAYFTFSKQMPDEEITEHVSAAGFDVIVIRETDKGKLAFYSIDDANAISKATDMAYKLKGAYAPEKSVIETVHTVDPEALSLAKQILEQRRNKTSIRGDGIISEPLGGATQD